MRSLERTWTVLALVATGSLLGCSPYGALCIDEMDCRGGNDEDIEACEIGYASQEDVADVYDCMPEWDDYVACLEKNAECQGDNFTHEGRCNDEGQELAQCLD